MVSRDCVCVCMCVCECICLPCLFQTTPVLHCVAVCCNVVQCGAVYVIVCCRCRERNVLLQCCSVLTVVQCYTAVYIAMNCSVYYSVLLCVAGVVHAEVSRTTKRVLGKMPGDTRFCSVLQRVALAVSCSACCSMLQIVALPSMPESLAIQKKSWERHLLEWHLQRVAVCGNCSVLQCVTVCCSGSLLGCLQARAFLAEFRVHHSCQKLHATLLLEIACLNICVGS